MTADLLRRLRLLSLVRRSVLLAPLTAWACGGPGPVQVSLALPNGPLAETSIAVLPYDPSRVLDSLARASATPRPTFPGLDSAMRAYAPGGDVNDLGSAAHAWQATRDSAIALADSLRAANRHAPGYAAAYGRFRTLYDHLTARAAARDSALRTRTGSRRALAERAARDADSLRAWERVAYAAYPDVAARALQRSGRSARTATTDENGRVTLDLPRGDWWLVVRVPDPENPFLEYRWNVGVRVTGFPIRVPLRAIDAHHAWRH